MKISPCPQMFVMILHPCSCFRSVEQAIEIVLCDCFVATPVLEQEGGQGRTYKLVLIP